MLTKELSNIFLPLIFWGKFMSKFILKFTLNLLICVVISGILFAQDKPQQTADSKVSNHEAVCDGALELSPSTMKFERKRYVKKSVARPVKSKNRK